MVYEKEINKLEKYLKIEKDYYQKIKLMDTLRYFYKENEKDKDRVVYKAESDSLEYSKSINIAIEITKLVPQALDKIEEDKKSEVVTIMKNNYYYLSGYLFSYYVVAIEFGIPPEKQFFAPRTSVLGPISKKLDKFYYKPKAVMTISMPQGTGKEQPLSSKILTPEGWITMGEVKVGTKVIGADGKVCNVTGVFPKGIKDVYRVTFDDNTFVDCGLEHLWEVQTEKTGKEILNTKQILNKKQNYYVRLVKPVENEKYTIEYRQKVLREIIHYSQKIYKSDMYIYQINSSKLIKEYTEIIRSLGYFAIQKDNKILIDFERKRKKIVNIEKVRREECQCIMIDHPEHLYITDGYTLTHNTELGKRFMSFCIGKAPDLPNMMVSYSATIAKDKFYQGEMTLIEDENGNFQKIFPDLKNVLKSAENMTLDYRNDEKKKPHSEYTLYCCGFDGGITGRTRAHNVLYIDDLIKNIEEARNKDVLDKKWEEFTATLKKRMQGNCKMLIIGTIFSINDPLSRIIKYYKDRNPDRIEVVRVPRIK